MSCSAERERLRSTPKGQAMAGVVRKQFVLPFLSLGWRELIRFYRQRHRLLGALATPLVFWILIGSGLGASFHPPVQAPAREMTALSYLYPGTLLLILLFTSIFSTISIIEDRREGFLQSVLVAPASRTAVVLGKIVGGTVVALLQGVIFLLLAPWVGVKFTIESAIVLAGLVFLISFGLTAMGLAIAWRMQSTQGFHAIMNLVLIPLWLLSGAFFPASGAERVVRWIMKWNPLSYAVAALRHGLYADEVFHLEEPSMRLSVLVVTVFGLILFVYASQKASRHTSGDYR